MSVTKYVLSSSIIIVIQLQFLRANADYVCNKMKLELKQTEKNKFKQFQRRMNYYGNLEPIGLTKARVKGNKHTRDIY